MNLPEPRSCHLLLAVVLSAVLTPGLARAAVHATAQTPPAAASCEPCQRADALAAQGDTLGAIEILRRASEESPGSGEVWGRLGTFLTRIAPTTERDYAMRLEAERALERALRLDPGNPRWLHARGLLLRKQGIRTDAERVLGRALESAESGRGDLTARELAEIYVERARILEEHVLDFEGLLPVAREVVPIMAPECQELGAFCLNFTRPTRFHQQLLSLTPPDLVGDRRARMREYFSAAFALDPTLDVAARSLMGDLARRQEWSAFLSVAREYLAASGGGNGWPYIFAAAGHHREGDWNAADSLFREGLTRLNEADRRMLHDVRPILSQSMEERYFAEAGDRSEVVTDLLWRHLNPFNLTEVNERQHEHMTRVALAELWFGEPLGDRRGYATDRGEILVRYGEPKHIRQIPREPTNEARADDDGDFDTVAGGAAGGRWVFWTYTEDAPSFIFEKALRSRTVRYGVQTASRHFVEEVREEQPVAPFDLPGVTELPHQIVRFRGEGAAVEADIFVQLPADGLAEEEEVSGRVGFFVLPFTLGQQVTRVESAVQFWDVPRVVTFRVPLDPAQYPYSIEALSDDGRIKARSRAQLPVEAFEGFSVSDVLLAYHVEPVRDPARTRRDMRIRASGDRTFEPGATVGLYFEVYDLEFADDGSGAFRVTVQLKDDQDQGITRGVIRRLAELVGRSDDGAPITWERFVEGPAERVPEWFTISLPEDQAPGDYVVEITIQDTRNGETAQVRQSFQIAAP